MIGVENVFMVILSIVLGGRSPLALHHGQCSPGRGKDLNHELPNQLQTACIHLFGWLKFTTPVNYTRLGQYLGVCFSQPPSQLLRGWVHVWVSPLHVCWIYGRCPCVGCHQVNMGVQNFAMYGVTWCASLNCFHGNSPHRHAPQSHHHYTSSLHRNAPHSYQHDARGSWSIQS